MTDDHLVALRLDVSADAEPIRGLLTGADGAPHPFVGWLRLASVIERLLRPPGADGPTPSG